MSGRYEQWRRLVGDTDRPELVNAGKKLLGYLAQQRALGGPPTMAAQRTLPDGSVVRARFDQDIPVIEVLAAPGGGAQTVCELFLDTGLVVHSTQTLRFGDTSQCAANGPGLQGRLRLLEVTEANGATQGHLQSTCRADAGAAVPTRVLETGTPPEGIAFGPKADTQQAIPASMFTGLMRLYVQALYGNPAAHYGHVRYAHGGQTQGTSSGDGWDDEEVRTVNGGLSSRQHDFLQLAAKAGDGTWQPLRVSFNYQYNNAGFFDILDSDVPGTAGIVQQDALTFWLVEVRQTAVWFRRLLFTDCGLRVLRLADSREASKPELARKLRAYAFASAVPEFEPAHAVPISGLNEDVPVGCYGWKFNRTGSQAAVVAFDKSFFTSLTIANLYTLAITFNAAGLPQAVVTHVESSNAFYVSGADNRTRSPFMAVLETRPAYLGSVRSARFGDFTPPKSQIETTWDIPVYCWFKPDDTLEVIRYQWAPGAVVPGYLIPRPDPLEGYVQLRQNDRRWFTQGYTCSHLSTTASAMLCDWSTDPLTPNNAFTDRWGSTEAYGYGEWDSASAPLQGFDIYTTDATLPLLLIPHGAADAAVFITSRRQGMYTATVGEGGTPYYYGLINLDETRSAHLVSPAGVTALGTQVGTWYEETPVPSGLSGVPPWADTTNDALGAPLAPAPPRKSVFVWGLNHEVDTSFRYPTSYSGLAARVLRSDGGAALYPSPLFAAPALTALADGDLAASHDYQPAAAAAFAGWA